MKKKIINKLSDETCQFIIYYQSLNSLFAKNKKRTKKFNNSNKN